jgi:2-oxoglutarate dehydrogenase E2 component (dihydrolipoamide succinyltransferase)
MAVEIKVPSPGESVTEGTISRWHKPNGSFVKMDEPVFELESDKAAIDVNAPASGVLKIAVPEGSTVQVGAVVGSIDETAKTPAEKPQPVKAGDGRAKTETDPGAVPVSPAARKVAADTGVDVARVAGTGRGGTVLKEDVVAAKSDTTQGGERAAPRTQYSVLGTQYSAPAPPAPTPRPSDGQRETRQKMSTIRQRIAERLVAVQQNAAILRPT